MVTRPRSQALGFWWLHGLGLAARCMPRRTPAARADFTTHRDTFNSRRLGLPASSGTALLQVECFQVRAGGGGGGGGDRISVWPPPLRERPRRRWERHEHSSWTRPHWQCNLNDSELFINATSARVSHGQCMYTASGNLADSDVRGAHVSPRLRRDYDGLAEQIRIASFSTQSSSYGKLTTEERM